MRNTVFTEFVTANPEEKGLVKLPQAGLGVEAYTAMRVIPVVPV
jgi:hypothetical protein